MPERVRKTLCLKGMKAFEIQERVDQPVAGRIAVVNRRQVDAERGSKLGVAVEDAQERLPDEVGVHIVVTKALGEPVADGVFELAVIEDIRADERGQLRLPPDDILRFGANLIPHRIAGWHFSCPLAAAFSIQHRRALRCGIANSHGV